MSGHTPGPWAVFHDHQDPATALSLGYVRREADDMGWATPWGFSSIADCFGCEHPEQAANARLIAAAPELLAEVEREYETLADIRNEWAGRYTPQGQAKLCRLRDLIAKATGRTEQDVQDDFGNRAIARIAKATGASA